MPNANWACFDCRRSVRRADDAEGVACPECGQPCESVGRTLALPSRRDEKAWRALRDRVRRDAARRALLTYRYRNR